MSVRITLTSKEVELLVEADNHFFDYDGLPTEKEEEMEDTFRKEFDDLIRRIAVRNAK